MAVRVVTSDGMDLSIIHLHDRVAPEDLRLIRSVFKARPVFPPFRPVINWIHIGTSFSDIDYTVLQAHREALAELVTTLTPLPIAPTHNQSILVCQDEIAGMINKIWAQLVREDESLPFEHSFVTSLEDACRALGRPETDARTIRAEIGFTPLAERRPPLDRRRPGLSLKAVPGGNDTARTGPGAKPT